MGEFSAGRWIVGLSFYFVTFYLICYAVAGAVNDTAGENAGVTYSDPGFGSSNPSMNSSNPGDVDSDDWAGSGDKFGSGTSAWSIMTGISASNTGVGDLGGWDWVFSFIFFWIPALMYAWCIYMALPFLH